MASRTHVRLGEIGSSSGESQGRGANVAELPPDVAAAYGDVFPR